MSPNHWVKWLLHPSLICLCQRQIQPQTNKEKRKRVTQKKGNGQKCGKTVLTSHSNFSDLKLSANVKPGLRYNSLTCLSF